MPNQPLPNAKTPKQKYMVGLHNAWEKGITPSEYKKQLSDDMLIINSINSALQDKNHRQKAINDLINKNKKW